MRRRFVVIHRYLGLVLAGFLIFAGLTGSLLAWYHELDIVFNPAMKQPLPAQPGIEPLDPLLLRDRVAERYPDANVHWVMLRHLPGESLLLGIDGAIDPVTGASSERANDEVYVDRYTGQIIDERKWGDITQGFKNLMPFIYRLHYSLGLEIIGDYFLGIIALLWTMDCFIGAYLTFPARRRKAGVSGRRLVHAGVDWDWLKRWTPAWKVGRRCNTYKLNFDLHRAGGLWPWAMLLVIAWSSVGFNLAEVYHPIMSSMFTFQKQHEQIPALPKPQPTPGIPWMEARDIGRRLMAEESQQKGFRVIEEHLLAYDPYKALYRYVVKSDRDIRDQWGSTMIYFDANTGERRATFFAIGAASGDTITHWLFSLHMAALWGMPFKLFVSGMGFVVAMLSITGLVIWHRKWRARFHGKQKKSAVLD